MEYIDTLSCGICREKYVESFEVPIVYNCGHSICKICDTNIKINCPLCQTKITTRSKNFLISDMIEKIKEDEKQKMYIKFTPMMIKIYESVNLDEILTTLNTKDEFAIFIDSYLSLVDIKNDIIKKIYKKLV